MIVKVTPIQDCEFCHGTGVVIIDYVDRRPIENLCSCVEEQVERDDAIIELGFEDAE